MTNLETEPAPLPPPTPMTAPPHDHRWARSDDRIMLGVAGGLGRALAIDPLLVRIGFVVLSLFSGVGLLLYIGGLALLADSPTSPPPSTQRRIGGVIAVLVSMSWLFNGDADLPDAGWVVAIGLLGAAVALWRGQAPADTRSAPPATEVQTAGDGGSTTDRWEALTTKQPKQPRPPRSPLGLLTVGAATVVGALVWLLNENAGIRGVWAFGWATVVLGAGMVVGAFAGRARWLISPAIATSIAALVASAMSFAGVGLDHRSGDRTEFIGAGSTVAARYRTGIGNFDLTIADYPTDLSTEVDVGVGNLEVVVPDNAHVQIDARVGIGAIDAFGSTRNGYRRALSIDDNPTGTPTIKLKLRVGVGNIEVRRGSFFDGPLIPVPTFLPEHPSITPVIPTDIAVLQAFGDGTTQFIDGSIDFGDGWRVEADGTSQAPIAAQNPDGSVQLGNGAVIQENGTVVSPGGFVIPLPEAESPPATLSISPPTSGSEVQP